jgi:SAM-dependent methyltransferase
MTNKTFDPTRRVGTETSKSYQYLIDSGFMQRYFSGDNIIEIGYSGGNGAVPITENAIGIDQGYPGYDGVHLPFTDASQDTVYSSHCLEHLPNPHAALAEWFRVVRVGGHLIIAVPHQQLYEKKMMMPSRYSNEHLKFYMPSTLLLDIERALPFGEWRLRGLYDNDMGFDYSLSAYEHSTGCLEIIAIIERIPHHAYIDQMLVS